MARLPLTEEQKNQAQSKLVNSSLRVGVAMLFEHVPQAGWNVEASGCDTAELLMTMLEAIPDDGERIARFDSIARDNGFKLAFKSEGAKSTESIAAKLARKGPNTKEEDLTDLIRLSVFSEDLELLDTYATRLQKATATAASAGELEQWHLKQSGALLNVLKCKLDGINGEVQFIPQQQARLATRITHHFYKIVQDYEALDEHADPERVAAIVARYNAVAKIINELASDATLDQMTMRKKMNTLLSSADFDPLTLDENNEGLNPSDKVRYSEIFKSNRDIQNYRQFFRNLGPALELYPMDELPPNASLAQLDIPMMRLLNCSQITYAGYIQDAPENLRNRWVGLAYALNEISGRPDREAIPSALIEAVPHTVEKGRQNGRVL